MREEVITTAVIGNVSTTDTIVTTASDAILGDAYVIVIVIAFATSGAKLCIVHTTGKYDLTLPCSSLSTVKRCDTKQLLKSPLQVLILTAWYRVGGEEWK